MFPAPSLWSRYWFALALLLALELTGWLPLSGLLLVSLGVAQVLHRRAREPGWTTLPIQVRITYLGVLLLGLLPPLGWLHLAQLAGTLALLVFDYCALARTLALMPWNRTQPLSARFVWRAFTLRPVSGSIVAALQQARDEAAPTERARA